ncbi:amino acid adenylation domain-containing protein [Tumebacillus lipolyticus]|uniref:Amino acid adenylation domain-containing protein n=1 Tax=Tumebacillus lipolyticus TaxID=1280370 RepID=A0ABW4ZRW5_9BACL
MTIIELLQRRAHEQQNQLAYTFMGEDGTEHTLTYGQLDREAKAIAVELMHQGAEVGDRALLLYAPGIAYICSFFGCLYAGVVAVPAYPPRSNGNLGRLQAMVEDAKARFALTSTEILRGVERRFAETPELSDLCWLVPGAAERKMGELSLPQLSERDLAFLQYTSGSTSLPKGVMLTHGNLVHNLGLIERCFGTSAEDRCVIWLPPYHDMGLIGGVMQPLFTGYPVTLMAPVDFIQKPLKWLETISKNKATVSGGPNFAYELCLQKVTPEQRDQLDLSSWQIAFTGAEPVRAETLDRFAEFFAPCGFRKEVFYPCYGLAEGTLFVAGGKKSDAPVVRAFEGEALLEDRAVTGGDRLLVSSGRVNEVEQRVAVVDTLTGQIAADGRVGEIWVSGPSVAAGYWNRAEQTEEFFAARLASGEGPFLRTGDLGFVHEGELFVTGRQKDLIIIRGQNYYPQDLEFVVQNSHPAVHNSNGAAFSVLVDGEERLVVVQEVERAHRKGNLAEVVQTIRQEVSKEHQLQVYAVVLLKPVSIPKTSSGKVQRHLCKERFLNGSLEVMYQEVLGESVESGGVHNAERPADADVDLQVTGNSEAIDLQDLRLREAGDRQALVVKHLQRAVSAVLKAGHVEIDLSLQALGMDSMMAVELKHQVEESFQIRLPLDFLLDGPSVEQVAEEVCQRLAVGVEADLEVRAGDLSEHALSHGQRALWFLQRLAPESAAYNIARAFRVTGLDVERLKGAVDRLVERHSQLRTVFSERDGEPVQNVLPVADGYFVHESIAEAELKARMDREANRPFDLEAGPLFRLYLFEVEEGTPVMLWVMHHIIVDLWSFDVLLKELGTLFTGEELPAPRSSYAEYVAWQKALLGSAEGEKMWAYWQEQLSGERAVLQLPTDRPRPPVQTYRGEEHRFLLGAELSAVLKSVARQQGVTLYALLMAAFQAFLYRYSGQEDILVGTPTTGRSSVKHAGVIGYFVNPVVLRGHVSGEMSFADFLARTSEKARGALQHGDFPFPLLVERIQPDRDLSQPPLFNVFFTLQSMEEGIAGIEMEPVQLSRQFAQFDLSLLMEEQEGELGGVVEFNCDLFEATTVERMIGHFQELLREVALNCKVEIGKMNMMTAEERTELLIGRNSTATPFPAETGLHQLLERQAAQTPDAVALVFEGESMTYRELNANANRLAWHLRERGVTDDVPVGVMAERSFSFVISIYAVLKAGGAYVPIDPDYPEERIQYLLSHSQTKLLLTQEKLLSRTEGGIAVDALLASSPSLPDQNLDLPYDPDRLMYILYTSGSTGTPKGVMIKSRSFANLVHWYKTEFEIGREDRVLLIAPSSFDLSQKNLFAPLIGGGRLVLFTPGLYDYDKMADTIERERVTLVNCAPSAFYPLLDLDLEKLRSLRQVHLGGETINLAKMKRWMKSASCSAELINTYGPTECTDIVSFYRVQPKDVEEAVSVPIGKPVYNAKLYVLDQGLNVLPQGAIGELCIGGIGLARGYYAAEDLTAAKFVQTPHLPEQMVYKTGDLVRYLPDGNIDYLGRIDHQVKIRGIRIEVGEIQAVLLEHDQVAEALVMAQEDDAGNKRLVAYVTGEAGLDQLELRSHVKKKLPEFMVPSAFVVLEKFPLTPNGKVDRKALPVPEGALDRTAVPYVAPTTLTEEKLVAVWEEILQVDRVGIHDNFFDLGGHSLLATQVISRVRNQFEVTLPVTQVFEVPTVAELAKQIDRLKGEQKPQQRKLVRASRENHRIR